MYPQVVDQAFGSCRSASSLIVLKSKISAKVELQTRLNCV